jgi:hypothetical protein
MLTPARLLTCALTLACTFAFAADEPGFRSLFDGKTLAGWEGDAKFWRVENGSLVGETTAEKQPADKKNTFLVHRGGEFGDFELRFRYKVDGYNSGVQYRSIDKGGHHMEGLQADFEARWFVDKANPTAPKADRFSGMFFDEGGRMFMGQRGDVVIVRAGETDWKKPKLEKIGSVGDPKELEKVIKRDDWNDYIVIAKGNQFTHIINGRVMSIGIDEDTARYRARGLLGWQLHAGQPMKIEVRDIRIRELK